MPEINDKSKHFAIFLHDKFCHWNPTHGCSWYDEIKNGVHDWYGQHHQDWLIKGKAIADKVLNLLSYNWI